MNLDPHAHLPAGRFAYKDTHREGVAGEDAGGGEMAVMRGGRVFEKVGVNISTVHGALAPRAQEMMASRGIPGIDDDPRFLGIWYFTGRAYEFAESARRPYEHADVLDARRMVVRRRRRPQPDGFRSMRTRRISMPPTNAHAITMIRITIPGTRRGRTTIS